MANGEFEGRLGYDLAVRELGSGLADTLYRADFEARGVVAIGQESSLPEGVDPLTHEYRPVPASKGKIVQLVRPLKRD